MKTFTITTTKGTISTSTVVTEGTTVGQLMDNPVTAAQLGTSDSTVWIRNGVEMAPDAPVRDGDELEAVERAGEKG